MPNYDLPWTIDFDDIMLRLEGPCLIIYLSSVRVLFWPIVIISFSFMATISCIWMLMLIVCSLYPFGVCRNSCCYSCSFEFEWLNLFSLAVIVATLTSDSFLGNCRYVGIFMGSFMIWKSCLEWEVIAQKQITCFLETLLIEDFTQLKRFFFS